MASQLHINAIHPINSYAGKLSITFNIHTKISLLNKTNFSPYPTTPTFDQAMSNEYSQPGTDLDRK